VVYRISWGSGDTIEQLFRSICASSNFANNHGIDMLTIYDDALVINFINLLMTPATQHASQVGLRGISTRCLTSQKLVALAVSRQATLALGFGLANFQPLTNVVRPTGICLSIVDRAGSVVRIT